MQLREYKADSLINTIEKDPTEVEEVETGRGGEAELEAVEEVETGREGTAVK